MSSKLDPKLVFYAVLGLGLIYVVKKTADKVGEIVTKDINPASPDNIINRGVLSIGQAITGDPNWSLGGAVYDYFHPEEPVYVPTFSSEQLARIGGADVALKGYELAGTSWDVTTPANDSFGTISGSGAGLTGYELAGTSWDVTKQSNESFSSTAGY